MTVVDTPEKICEHFIKTGQKDEIEEKCENFAKKSRVGKEKPNSAKPRMSCKKARISRKSGEDRARRETCPRCGKCRLSPAGSLAPHGTRVKGVRSANLTGYFGIKKRTRVRRQMPPDAGSLDALGDWAFCAAFCRLFARASGYDCTRTSVVTARLRPSATAQLWRRCWPAGRSRTWRSGQSP